MIGKTVQVLVEGESKLSVKRRAILRPKSNSAGKKREEVSTQVTQLVGRTRGDQVVVFDGEKSLTGELLDVEIPKASNLTLFGKLAPAIVEAI